MLCVGKWIRKIFLLKVVLNLVVVFYPQRAAGNMCSQTLQNTIYTLQQHIRLLQHQMYTNCPPCPDSYNLVGERCYRVFTTELDWYTASANCSQDGAMLVSLQTQEEERALREFLQTKYAHLGAGARFYTSGNELDEKGVWKWGSGVDAELFSHENWTDGEPNDYNGESEKCMEIHIDEGWNDIPCYLPFMWICEATPAYIPYSSGPAYLEYNSGQTSIPSNSLPTYIPASFSSRIMGSNSGDEPKRVEPNDAINSAQLGWTDRMIHRRMEKFNKGYWQKVKGMDQHYKKIAEETVHGNGFMEASVTNRDTTQNNDIADKTIASSTITKAPEQYTKVDDYATSTMSPVSTTHNAEVEIKGSDNKVSKDSEQRDKPAAEKPSKQNTECTETTTQSFMVTVEP